MLSIHIRKASHYQSGKIDESPDCYGALTIMGTNAGRLGQRDIEQEV